MNINLNTSPLQVRPVYKPFIVPALALVLVLVLSLTLGQYIWAKIGEEQQTLEGLKTRNGQLTGKLGVLNSQNKEQLKTRAQAALRAVPADSPALLTLASAGSLASDKGVSLTDFRVTEKKEQKAQTTELALNLEGPLGATLDFLTSIKETAPLVKVSEIRTSLQDGLARTRLTAASIWGPLPVSLGSPEARVDPLTRPEEEIADKFTQLLKPSGRVVAVSQPQGRRNPFSP